MVDMSDAMCDERNARCIHLAECWAHGRRRFRGTRRDDLIEGWGEGDCQCTGGSTRRVLRIRWWEELPVQQLTTRMVAKIVRPDISPWVCCPN